MVRGSFWECAGSSITWSARNTSCTCACFSAGIAGIRLCPECNGSRLRLEARQVKINGKNICDVTALTVEDALRFFEKVQLSPEEAEIAEKLLDEIRERLRFLNDVGLEYLTLDRLSSTLSGGEAQRIQLATSLGSRLVGTLYVLDEPSIGLHPRDTHRLIKILHDLRESGEHDSGGGARSRHHAGGGSDSGSRARGWGEWRQARGRGHLRGDSA